MKYKRIKINNLNNDGIINLLECFMTYLREDYIRIFDLVKKDPSDKQSLENLNCIRGVFLSKYFGSITGLNGQDVLDDLDYQCNKKYRKVV